MSAGIEDFEESEPPPPPEPPPELPPPEPPPQMPVVDALPPPPEPDAEAEMEIAPPPPPDNGGLILDYDKAPIAPIEPVDSDPVEGPDWSPVKPVEMFEDAPDWERSRESFEEQTPLPDELPPEPTPPPADTVDISPPADDSSVAEPPPQLPEELPPESTDPLLDTPVENEVPVASIDAPLPPDRIDDVSPLDSPLTPNDGAAPEWIPEEEPLADQPVSDEGPADAPVPDLPQDTSPAPENVLPSPDASLPADSVDPPLPPENVPETPVDEGVPERSPEELPPEDEEHPEDNLEASANSAADETANAQMSRASKLPSGPGVDPEKPYRNANNDTVYVPTEHKGYRSAYESNGKDAEGDVDHIIPKAYAELIGITTVPAQDLDRSRNRSLGATVDKKAAKEWATELLADSKSVLPDPDVSDKWRTAPLTAALYQVHQGKGTLDLAKVREQIKQRSLDRANSPNWPKSK